MNRTPIEWAEFTWTPVVGCSRRCEWCYAWRMAKRNIWKCQKCREFVPHLHPERLGQPEKRKKPARIFVCPTGDLFDPHVEDVAVCDVLEAMDAAPQHTYLLLTKQPEGSLAWDMRPEYGSKPGKTVHLGVSVATQEDADERIPFLFHCDFTAAVRWVSYEPALGPVSFAKWLSWEKPRIDWLVIGAETGNRKGKVVPKREWIERPLERVGAMPNPVPVFVKDNVVALYPEFAGIRAYPEEVTS